MWLAFISPGSSPPELPGAGARRHLYPTLCDEHMGPSVSAEVQSEVHGLRFLSS